uniref:Ig-like domain-containing protein n=1 Tax=Nothobranchius furzeri TaxID=105023 RepID=A0A8C6P4V5_NOTFU
CVTYTFHHHVYLVEFTNKSLESPSITLRNVTWADEGFYSCTVYDYAVDGLRARSPRDCYFVTVQARWVALSCSATGKPAPSINWVILPGAGDQTDLQNSTVLNHDGTATSISNITLRIPVNWAGTVTCLLNKDTRGEKSKRVFSYRGGKLKRNGT